MPFKYYSFGNRHNVKICQQRILKRHCREVFLFHVLAQQTLSSILTLPSVSLHDFHSVQLFQGIHLHQNQALKVLRGQTYPAARHPVLTASLVPSLRQGRYNSVLVAHFCFNSFYQYPREWMSVRLLMEGFWQIMPCNFLPFRWDCVFSNKTQISVLGWFMGWGKLFL